MLDARLSEALEGLQVVEGSPENDRDLIICPRPEPRAPEVPGAAGALDVILRQERGQLSAIQVIGKVATALHAAQHPFLTNTNEHRLQIAGAVLALSLLQRRQEDSVLHAINGAIKMIEPTFVFAIALLPGTTGNPEKHRFGEFTYGAVDLNKLRERCERAGSDYFDRYGESLRGRYSLRREDREMSLFNPNRLDGSRAGGASITYRLTEHYYQRLAEEGRREFLTELERQQAVYAAAGLGTIRSQALTFGAGDAGNFLTIFARRQRKQGWVLPIRNILIYQPVDPSAYANGRRKIDARLAVSDWGARPLDKAIQSFCEYFAAAESIADEGKLDEALLHVVFGLDRLLGGAKTESLVKILSERIGILVHRALGLPTTEVGRRVKNCYRLRSGYVHEGQRGDLETTYGEIKLAELYEELVTICRAVFAAACFARVQPWAQTGDARAGWVARLDILRIKNGAEISPTEAEVPELGLGRVRLAHDELPAVIVDWAGVETSHRPRNEGSMEKE